MFLQRFVENRGTFSVPECHFKQLGNGIEATVTIARGKDTAVVTAVGNGRLDAVTEALKAHFGIEFELTTYEQRALSEKSDSQALSFVGVEKGGKAYWGAGVDEDIIQSSINALVSALNNYFAG